MSQREDGEIPGQRHKTDANMRRVSKHLSIQTRYSVAGAERVRGDRGEDTV